MAEPVKANAGGMQFADGSNRPAGRQQPVRSGRQPIVIQPGQSVADICRNDEAKLTCDIASDVERLRRADRLAGLLIVQDRKTDNPRANINISADMTTIVNTIQESARNGHVADFLIGDLAVRGTTRDSNVKAPDGSPIDLIVPLSTRIMQAATTNPPLPTIPLSRPLNINNTRACLNSHANVIMKLEETLGTKGQPKEVTDKTLRDLVANDRLAKTDAQLVRDVNAHILRPGRSEDYTNLLQDCGFLGLRHLNDEGFRYEGRHMVTPPQTPSAVAPFSASVQQLPPKPAPAENAQPKRW